MKKGIHYWALPPQMNLRDKFFFASDCGFDGVEPVILPHGELSINSDDKSLERIRKNADDAGIEILSLTNALNWNASFTSDKEEIREKAFDILSRQIRIASALGVDSILVIPGYVSVDFVSKDLHPSEDTDKNDNYHPSEEIIRYDIAYKRALDGMKRAVEVAEKEKITLCIENTWSKFLLSPLEMCSFIDEINSPFLKAYFDIGNVCPFGIPQHWIEILGKRINRVHVKDYKNGNLTLSSFVELGKGDINLEAVASSLRNIGYEGWVTAELNVDIDNPYRVARETVKVMKKLFGDKEDKNG